MKTRSFDLLIVSIFVVAIALACGGSGKNVAEPYVGDWKAADGTTWTIRLDGTCDYKSSTKSVTNGSMTWDTAQGLATIDFGDNKVDWKPIKLDETKTTLTFGGTVFKRAGTN